MIPELIAGYILLRLALLSVACLMAAIALTCRSLDGASKAAWRRLGRLPIIYKLLLGSWVYVGMAHLFRVI